MGGSAVLGHSTLRLLTDQRADFFYQVPAIRVHTALRQVLCLPENVFVRVHDPATSMSTTAWLVSGDEQGEWAGCRSPWHRSVQLSAATWRRLAGDRPPISGHALEITVPTQRMPIRPGRSEWLLAGHEIGLHSDDARRLGLTKWAAVNHRGIPGLFRVRRSDQERDRGIVRLSYQARLLLGVRARRHDLLPELLIGSTELSDRLPLIDEPKLEGPLTGRWRRGLRWPGAILERTVAAILRAPEITLLTTDAQPGEDQMLTVRLPPGLFPLIGTFPGQQVYVSWGPRNRVVATALAEENEFRGVFADTDKVGSRVPAERIPPVAMVRLGSESRVTLGVPRTTVVTVRRRVTSLILGRLNELILPVTGLFVAGAANVRLLQWRLLVAGLLILALLLAPLRVRRNPRGKVP